MWVSISAAAVAAFLIFYIKLYNRLKRLSVKVAEGSAGIDVALEKRYDMLSNELEAVKKFLNHEHQVYTEVTALRTGKELDEAAFEAKKAMSEEAVKIIGDTIQEQQEQMHEIRKKLDQQRNQGEGSGAGIPEEGNGELTVQQMSLERKLGLLTSVHRGLTGVDSAVNGR